MKQITKEDFSRVIAQAIENCIDKGREINADNTTMPILLVGTLVGIEIKTILFEEEDNIEIVSKEE